MGKYINNRNLVVCETVDEFSEKVSNTDFNVEDIVGYITSINNNFYWLNVESVWGNLGFTWDKLSEDTSIPTIWNTLEQTIALGKNVGEGQEGLTDEEQKQMIEALARRDEKVSKGYGHFNVSTVPFTIIPKLPDGYRITEFNNTFNKISSDYIKVYKSDWSNLKKVNYLVRKGQSIDIDLTGAEFDGSTTQYIIAKNQTGVDTYCTQWRSTVYIKGDLKGIVSGYYDTDAPNNYNWSNYCRQHTTLLDDNNKGLNIATSLQTHNQFYYTNENEFFDIRDWLYDTGTQAKAYYILCAASKKYYINWKFEERLLNAGGTIGLSHWDSENISPDNWRLTYAITDPIEQGLSPKTIVIDATDSDGNIREDRLFKLSGNDSDSDSIDGRYLPWCCGHICNPIQYKGEVNSITMYNPFCVVTDDTWPEYNQDLVDKLVPFQTNTSYGSGEFMFGSYFYITKPSPYTIDCSKLKWLSLFKSSVLICNDYSNFRKIGNNKYAFFPVKLTNVDLECFTYANMGRAGKGVNYDIYWELPTLKARHISRRDPVRAFIPKTSTITLLTWAVYLWDSILVEDFTHTAFKFDSPETYKGVTSNNWYIYFNPGNSNFTELNTSTEAINMFEFDSNILADKEYLKRCSISTCLSTSREILHPLVCVYPYHHISFNNISINISSDFIFIYRCNISLTGYKKWSNLSNPINALVNQFIPNIEPNDTTTVYSLTLSKVIYDELLSNYSDKVDYIINTINYQIVVVNN